MKDETRPLADAREHLRRRLLALPLGAGAFLAVRWVVRARLDAWSVWGKGQCRCERPAGEALSLAQTLDLLAPPAAGATDTDPPAPGD